MEVLVNLESNKQYPTLVQHGAETHIPIQVMSVIALLDSLKFTRFPAIATRMYNHVVHHGTILLAQTNEPFKVGLAYLYNLMLLDFPDLDIAKSSAAKSYYCLARAIQEDRQDKLAAMWLYILIVANKKDLVNLFDEIIYNKRYSPYNPFTMIDMHTVQTQEYQEKMIYPHMYKVLLYLYFYVESDLKNPPLANYAESSAVRESGLHFVFDLIVQQHKKIEEVKREGKQLFIQIFQRLDSLMRNE